MHKTGSQERLSCLRSIALPSFQPDENSKVSLDVAKMLKCKKVSDDRVRWLNQFPPLPTKVDYLKPRQTEEARLRAVIEHDFAEHEEEFDIALNTGMRSKEQYTRIDWSSVDLVRKDLAIPQSKNGKGRHIPLERHRRCRVRAPAYSQGRQWGSTDSGRRPDLYRERRRRVTGSQALVSEGGKEGGSD